MGEPTFLEVGGQAVHELEVLVGCASVWVGHLHIVLEPSDVKLGVFIDGGGCWCWVDLRNHQSNIDTGVYNVLLSPSGYKSLYISYTLPT